MYAMRSDVWDSEGKPAKTQESPKFKGIRPAPSVQMSSAAGMLRAEEGIRRAPSVQISSAAGMLQADEGEGQRCAPQPPRASSAPTLRPQSSKRQSTLRGLRPLLSGSPGSKSAAQARASETRAPPRHCTVSGFKQDTGQPEAERSTAVPIMMAPTFTEMDRVLAERLWDQCGVVSPSTGLAYLGVRKSAAHPAMQATAVRRLNAARFKDLSFQDVENLMLDLDTTRRGQLTMDDVKVLLTDVLRPPCTTAQVEVLSAFMDFDEDGLVSSRELYSALVAGPTKAHLQKLHREFRERQRINAARGLKTQLDRSLLVESVNAANHVKDALKTLPFSMLSLVCFLTVVVVHVGIFQRYSAGSGVQDWIAGYGTDLTGPFLKEHVSEVQGMWSWLSQSGTASVFGDCRNTTTSEGRPLCRLASGHLLIGDAQLSIKRTDTSEESVWLLNSVSARAHLASHPDDFLGAARAEISRLWDAGWARDGVDELSMSFSTFNDREPLFTLTEAKVRVTSQSIVVPTVTSRGFPSDPYGNLGVLIFFDTVYALQLLVPFALEVKELVTNLRERGIRAGFRENANIWNAIDWSGIFIGLTGTVVWLACVQAMMGDAVQSILVDGALVPTAMSLDLSTVEAVRAGLVLVDDRFLILHTIMALNIVTIIGKFFKAFQANPRLEVVTQTLLKSASDMGHFMIIFIVTFLAFSAIGHILFGNDLKEFRTMYISFVTAFNVLMGEFSWFVSALNDFNDLPSGMPTAVVVVWYWAYVVFVLHILLNMLLAIVFEQYSMVTREMLHSKSAVPLWSQTRTFLNHKHKTRGFISMQQLERMLEHPDDPAHPQSKVDKWSVAEAFPTMKPKQVKTIIDWLGAEAVAQGMEPDDDLIMCLYKDFEWGAARVFEEHLNVTQKSMRLTQMIDWLASLVQVEAGQSQFNTRERGDADEEEDEEIGEEDAASFLHQLASQNEALAQMAQVVNNLAARVDTVAPRMQEAPAALRKLGDEVAELRRRLESMSL